MFYDAPSAYLSTTETFKSYIPALGEDPCIYPEARHLLNLPSRPNSTEKLCLVVTEDCVLPHTYLQACIDQGHRNARSTTVLHRA